jgi:hypothetical protein
VFRLLGRRGAVGTSLLFGVGSGLLLGVSFDVALMLFQGGDVPELIGTLGLPGAVLALVGAFFLGAKAWQTLKATGSGKSDYGYKDAMALRDQILAEIAKTRHDMRDVIAEAMAAGTLATTEIMRKLDAMERESRNRGER